MKYRTIPKKFVLHRLFKPKFVPERVNFDLGWLPWRTERGGERINNNCPV